MGISRYLQREPEYYPPGCYIDLISHDTAASAGSGLLSSCGQWDEMVPQCHGSAPLPCFLLPCSPLQSCESTS